MAAVARSPGDILNYRALADYYRETGQLRKAGLTLKRMLEIDPTNATGWTDLAAVLAQQEDWRDAADALERAVSLTPDDPGLLARWGAALLAARDLSAATAVRDSLLEKFSGRWEGSLLAGHLQKIHGEADRAAEAYGRTLAVEPKQTDALFNLVDIDPPPPGHQLTRRLAALAADASLPARDAANVLFALARIDDRAGRAEQAIARFHAANTAAARALAELGVVYDPARMEAETARMIALFDGETLGTPLSPLDLDLRLIFVTGMPRSGTTLVERVLASHPSVVSGGEMPFMQECLATLLGSPQGRAQRAIDARDDGAYRLLNELREHYLDRLFERDLEGEYVVDKLPANFNAIGLIRLLFPDARIVHCARHPVATCWSLYTAHFGMHLPYNTSFEHLAHYASRVHAVAMRHWRSLENCGIIETKYERLVGGPEAEIRALVDRCGLSWDDRCLAFHENEAPVFTANMLSVRQPVTAARADHWRQYERHLEPLKRALRDADMDLET